MSNGVNNNIDISLQELQQKLVNVEETEHKTTGMKSIFNAYNTHVQQGENEVERLTKGELESFVQKLQTYDRNGGTPDGKLDMDEINDFVRDFNSEHPNERITSEDVFQFVNNIFTKNSLYNKPIKSGQGIQKVGEPLSTKTVRLQCMDENSDIVEIVLEISLYATEDETTPLLYENKVVQGAQYKNLLASKYGYTGDDAWSNFTRGSLRPPNPDTYEVKFFPIAKDGMSVGSNDDITAIPVVQGLDSADGIVSYYMPNGFDRDPQAILAEYQNPKAREAMEGFITYLEGAIADTEAALENCLDSYGWTAKTADWIASLFVDDDIAGSHTEEQVRNAISEARNLLEKMKETLKEDSNANTMEGILRGEDFGAYYQNLTGKEFRARKIMDFMEARNQMLQAQSVYAMNMYIHDKLNTTISMFENMTFAEETPDNASSSFANPLLAPFGADGESGSLVSSPFNTSQSGFFIYNDKHSALQYLGEVFYPVLGISSENWETMMNQLEEQGRDPIKFCRDLANNLATAADTQAQAVLGTSNPDGMKNIIAGYEGNYNSKKGGVVGAGDRMSVLRKYHNSQMLGSGLISGVAQIGVYALCMALCPASAPVLLSGLASGASYAASYVAVEVSDRLSNNIDNSEDLWNSEVMRELGGNAAIEFAAGFAFDGLFKAPFSNAEKNVLAADKRMTAERLAAQADTPLGETFYTKFGARFSKENIKQFLKVRGAAGVIGGTKDSMKEEFKQGLHLSFNLKAVCTAFLVGTVSNALFIKFKNSPFAKKNHRVMGKFIEKAPKKEGKTYLKDNIAELPPEEREMANLITEVRTKIIDDVRAKVAEDSEYAELLDFVTENATELDNLIMSCYIVDFLMEDGETL